MPYSSQLKDGDLVNQRYRIVRCLGYGGFGRTYLAEDTHRFQESCVLKEFAPQAEAYADLRKAEDLFEREAGILYKLKHAQIPEFKALIRVQGRDKPGLYIVQEYIVGETYWNLIQQGKRLNEAEARKLLLDLLPVLSYIHSYNLIHRDISPDNLILRSSDQKPVLIDFGCVKEAAKAASGWSRQKLRTVVGKKGYAPDEQLMFGQAYANSDLYSLAVTILVLLTGKQPQYLVDKDSGWDWRQVKISPQFKQVLTKMLAHQPGDRYSSAVQVNRAIENLPEATFNRNIINTINSFFPNPTRNQTVPIITSNPNNSRLKTQVITRKNNKSNHKYNRWWGKGLIYLAAILLPLTAFALISQIDFGFSIDQPAVVVNEQETLAQIEQRLNQLNVNRSQFYAQVDQIFYQRFEHLQGVALTQTEEHKKYRLEWYKIAEELLDDLEREARN